MAYQNMQGKLTSRVDHFEGKIYGLEDKIKELTHTSTEQEDFKPNKKGISRTLGQHENI